MPTGVQGIAPISGVVGFIDTTPEATPEERYGGTADPKHGIAGETATPYPWEVFPGEQHGPYGQENGLLSAFGIAVLAEPAGVLSDDPTADLQPITHAAPWPKGVYQTTRPDDVAERRQEMADIHASNMGGSREMLMLPTAYAQNDEWTELLESNPGGSLMVPIPQQVMAGGTGGFGSRDRVQSQARQNEYGYDTAHMHRRWATGSIPGNTMWLKPGGRPMVKTTPGTAKVPVGVDSPFHGQVQGDPFNSYGAALADLPAEYSAPPVPALATGYPDASQGAPVIALW